MNMNPVLEAVNHFWHVHPFLTLLLGVAFFPEIELVIVLLALLATVVQ